MTCSSNTTCTVEAGRRLRGWLAAFALVLALGLAPLAGHAEPRTAATLIAAARDALRRNDGIDAEMKLRAAMAQGVARDQVAAFMGGAFIRQGDLQHARDWLGPGVFSPDTAAEGFRVLATLEQQDGDLAAASKAYDRALAITPNDADLWVEIGRLRYRFGQHMLAIRTADHAIALQPRNVRAMEFRGELVRDHEGMLAALPWFERALAQAPADVETLTQYAATLGELGRATEMLAVTRRLLKVDAGNPRAFYLQAVLAARAGRYDVARQLLARTRGKLDAVPGAMLLGAVLELSAGNMQTASELCEDLLRKEPENTHAKQLLARALYLSDQYRYLTLRFRDDIARDDASPYLLTVVARAYEAVGDRVAAGGLLDRASTAPVSALRIVASGSPVGALMAQGRSQEALTAAQHDLAAMPGSYAAQSIAGDVELALKHAVEAQRHYAAAAQIRMSDNLLQRRFQAFRAANDARGAAQMVGAFLRQNPTSRIAWRLQANLAVRGGDPLRAASILKYLRDTGSADDVQLLTDLALIQAGIGTADAGANVAERAYRLQRANPMATQTLALSYATLAIRPAEAAALIDKARKMLGDNPLLTEASARLQRGQPG